MSFLFLLLLFMLLCYLPVQLLVIHCRALLNAAAIVELCTGTKRDFGLHEDELSGCRFRRIVLLTRLCPEVEGAPSLRLIEIYFGLLTLTRKLPPACAYRLFPDPEGEVHACTHFAAVLLERRIARVREAAQETRANR